MKRSGFKRKSPERVRTVPEPIPMHLRRNAVFAKMDVAAAPIEKFTYVRSRPLLNAIKALPCMHCGASGPSDPAHSNELRHGKARSKKASDVFCAALCRADHHELDQGHRLTRDERQAMWTNAWRATVRELVKRGTWPMNVPVPDIQIFN